MIWIWQIEGYDWLQKKSWYLFQDQVIYKQVCRLSQSWFLLDKVIRRSGGKQTFLACIVPFLTDQFSGQRCVGGVSEATSNQIYISLYCDVIFLGSARCQIFTSQTRFLGVNNMQIKFESMQAGQAVSSWLCRSFLVTTYTSLVCFSQRRAQKDDLGQVQQVWWEVNWKQYIKLSKYRVFLC